LESSSLSFLKDTKYTSPPIMAVTGPSMPWGDWRQRLVLQILLMRTSPTVAAERSEQRQNKRQTKCGLAMKATGAARDPETATAAEIEFWDLWQKRQGECGICLDDLNSTNGTDGKNDCGVLIPTMEEINKGVRSIFLERYSCTDNKSWNMGPCAGKNNKGGIPLPPKQCCAKTCCLLGETNKRTCVHKPKPTVNNLVNFFDKANQNMKSEQKINANQGHQFKIGLFWQADVQLILVMKATDQEQNTKKYCSCIGRCPDYCEGSDTTYVYQSYGKSGSQDAPMVRMANKFYNAVYIMGEKTKMHPGSYEVDATYRGATKGSNFQVDPKSKSGKPEKVGCSALMEVVDEKVVTSRKNITWKSGTIEDNSERLFNFTVGEVGEVSLH